MQLPFLDTTPAPRLFPGNVELRNLGVEDIELHLHTYRMAMATKLTMRGQVGAGPTHVQD